MLQARGWAAANAAFLDAAGVSYLNFAENEVDARTAYTADRWTKLEGIKSAVDPRGLIVANHRIPRPWENGRATD